MQQPAGGRRHAAAAISCAWQQTSARACASDGEVRADCGADSEHVEVGYVVGHDHRGGVGSVGGRHVFRAVHAQSKADGGERKAARREAEARDEGIRAEVWRVRVRRWAAQRHQRQAVRAHDGEQQRQARTRKRQRQEHNQLAERRQRGRARVQVRRRRQRLVCLLRCVSGRHGGSAGSAGCGWMMQHCSSASADQLWGGSKVSPVQRCGSCFSVARLRVAAERRAVSRAWWAGARLGATTRHEARVVPHFRTVQVRIWLYHRLGAPKTLRPSSALALRVAWRRSAAENACKRASCVDQHTF